MAIRVYSSDLYVELAIKHRAGAYPGAPRSHEFSDISHAAQSTPITAVAEIA